jgi:hypothetical protein
MDSKPFQLFLHGKGRPLVIEAEGGEVLRDLLAKHDALPSDDEFVYIGESEDGRETPDADCDDHRPADVKLTVIELDLPVKRHIHAKAVHSIAVTVEYNGNEPARRFSPNSTVETVLAWAKHKLHIDPVAGADLILELQPGKEIPRMDAHLGDLLKRGEKALHFKLVKEVTPQGRS